MKGLEYSRRCPGRPLRQAVWFDICRMACELFMKLVYRFRTYGVHLDSTCHNYMETVLTDPDFLAWEAQAEKDPPQEPLPG